MKSIKFNESELEFLKNHYELELVEAENYIAEIRNILKKLGVIIKDEAAEKHVKTGKKRGRPKKEAVVAAAPVTPVAKPAEKKKKSRKTKKAKVVASEKKVEPKIEKKRKVKAATKAPAKKPTPPKTLPEIAVKTEIPA